MTTKVLWKCPECGVASPSEDWKEAEPWCEDCGSHPGLQCPNPECEEVFDEIWNDDKLTEMKKNAVVDDGPGNSNSDR